MTSSAVVGTKVGMMFVVDILERGLRDVEVVVEV